MYGGEVLGGNFVKPTLTRVKPDMEVVQNEAFVPILHTMTFKVKEIKRLLLNVIFIDNVFYRLLMKLLVSTIRLLKVCQARSSPTSQRISSNGLVLLVLIVVSSTSISLLMVLRLVVLLVVKKQLVVVVKVVVMLGSSIVDEALGKLYC